MWCIIYLHHKRDRDKAGAYVSGKNKILYTTSPYYIILAHELIHALRISNGQLLPSNKTQKNPFVEKINKQFGTTYNSYESIEEMETIGVFDSDFRYSGITENKIRKEHNLRTRISHYHQ